MSNVTLFTLRPIFSAFKIICKMIGLRRDPLKPARVKAYPTICFHLEAGSLIAYTIACFTVPSTSGGRIILRRCYFVCGSNIAPPSMDSSSRARENGLLISSVKSVTFCSKKSNISSDIPDLNFM